MAMVKNKYGFGGAIWENKTKKGDTILSGTVKVAISDLIDSANGKDVVEIPIVAFKNQNKENPKAPDYSIALDNNKEIKPAWEKSFKG